MIPPVSLQLARRLLRYEAAAGRNSEPTESAAFRVYDKLRLPLCSSRLHQGSDERINAISPFLGQGFYPLTHGERNTRVIAQGQRNSRTMHSSLLG